MTVASAITTDGNIGLNMKEIIEQDILSIKDVAMRLNIPEDILRKWVSWNFRSIPSHVLNNGKKTEMCFFKDEIETWFERNGGSFLSKQVIGKNNTRERKKY